MHDGMPYDPIQGQGLKVTRPLKLEIFFQNLSPLAIFNVSWQMNIDSETMEQYLTFIWSRFLISPIFCVA